MHIRRTFLLLIASALLTGAKDEQTDALVKRCVERGNVETTCRCVLKIEEDMLGRKFHEAQYLQVIGDQTGYDKKLMEIVAENPQILQDLARVEARAQEQCFRE